MPNSTIFWSVDADGNWATTADWNLGRIPGAADDVTINTTHLHTVTHSAGADSIHTLAVGNDNLVVSGGALRVVSTASFAHLLTVSGGAMIFDGAATAASFVQSHGTVSGNGSLTITGAASLTGSLLQTSAGSTVLKGTSTLSGPGSQFGLDGGRTLENVGTFNLTGTTQLILGFNPFGTSLGGGALKNDAGATLDIQSSGLAISRFTGTTTFANAGTFEKTVGTGVASVGLAMTNTGQVLVQSGGLDLDGALTTSGSGTVQIATGAALDLFAGGSANASAITVAAGGTFELDGGVFTLGGGTMGGTGSMSVVAGTLEVTGGATLAGAFTVGGSGTTQVDAAATLTLAGGGSAKAAAFNGSGGGGLAGVLDFAGGTFALNAGTMAGSGLVEVTGGKLKIGAAVTLSGGFLQSAGTVQGAGTLTVDGPVTFSNRVTQTGAGVTLLEGASTVNAKRGVYLDGGRVLRNQGTLTCNSRLIALGGTASGKNQGGGTLQNDAGATFIIATTMEFLGLSGTVGIANAGLFEQAGNVGDTQFFAPFTNTGTISVQAGDFTLAAGGSSSGAITIAAGAVFVADGGFSLGGTVSGPGVLEVSGGTLSVGADVTLGGDFDQVASATSNTTLAGAGDLIVAGAATFSSKGFNGAILQTGPGTTLLQGAAIFDHGTIFALDGGRVLEIADTFTLTGKGDINLGDNPFGATLGGGTLKIDAGGTIDIQGTSQIVATSGATAFIIAGALERTVGSGRSVIGLAVTDSGAIEAASGTLEFTQAITGAGTMAVATGATLQVDASADATLSMSFGGGGATLALGNAASFAATIGGFAPTDVIDLLKTDADSATLGAGDTLVIAKGATVIATLQLAGDFTGDTFAVASDGASGSNITVTTPGPPPRDPGGAHRFLAAMAGLPNGSAALLNADPAGPERRANLPLSVPGVHLT